MPVDLKTALAASQVKFDPVAQILQEQQQEAQAVDNVAFELPIVLDPELAAFVNATMKRPDASHLRHSALLAQIVKLLRAIAPAGPLPPAPIQPPPVDATATASSASVVSVPAPAPAATATTVAK